MMREQVFPLLPVCPKILVHVDQRNIFLNPLESDYVYFCNDGGVYRYVISSNVYENLSNGLAITQFYDIAVSQSDPNIIGGGSQDNGNVYRASNGVWNDYAATGDGMNQEIDPNNANIRYWSYQLGGMYRWQNGSNTSIAPPGENNQGAWETPFKLDPNNSDRIIAGYRQIYASDDRGENWYTIGQQINGANVNQLAIAPSNSNRTDLEVDPYDMDVVYIVAPGYQAGKVFKSTDAGNSWQDITGSLPPVSVNAIETYSDEPGGLFVGTDAGVFYRDDTTNDWLEYGQLPHTRVDDIEIQYSSQLIRVGTHGRGVFEAAINIITCDNLPDADADGICDAYDTCPNFDDNLINTACDDGDPNTGGETWTASCTCEGGISTLNHCDAEGAAGTGADWISRVSINTINNSSSQTAYSDFKNIQTALAASGSYPLQVNLNYSFALDEVYAWIDWNKDGIFNNTNELINMSAISNDTSTGTVNVPANASGTTVMRVRVIYADPNTPQACGSIFGEVEDYTIKISADSDGDGFLDPEDDCPFEYGYATNNGCPCIDVELKAFLEGAYDTSTNEMTTGLNTERGLLPGQTPTSGIINPTPAGQPYHIAPWNYNGTEGANFTDSDYNDQIVDWVLISLRTGINKADEVAQAAALMKKNGTIATLIPCVIEDPTQTGPFHIVIEHRNHIGIMSPTTVAVSNGKLVYDFTTADSYRDPTSFGQKQLPTGEWTMFAGDADQADFPSYDIQGTDKTLWLLWFENNGISSRVPK